MGSAPMRSLWLAPAAFVVFAVAVACSSSKGGSPDVGSETSPPAATGGGVVGGGGANGSFTYDLSGGYTASGELPFVPEASRFSNGGWSATFSKGGDTIVAINSIPGSEIVNYGDPQVAVPAGGDDCTIDITQNDSSGLVGTFDCRGLSAVKSQTAEAITVDFSGAFEAHP